MRNTQITTHSLVIGKLSCVLYKQLNTSLAILIPPHPKHFGNSDNIIIKAMRNSFLKNNFSVLAVNLHMYCDSQSKVNDLHTRDVLQVVNWANRFFPYINHFWIGGVSFGSWVAINLAMRRPEFSGFICAGLPTKLYDFSFFVSCATPNLIIQADNDVTSDILNKKNSDASFAKKISSMNFCILEGETYKMNSPKSIRKIVDESYDFIKTSISGDANYDVYAKYKNHEVSNNMVKISNNLEDDELTKDSDINVDEWQNGDIMEEEFSC